MHYFLTEENDLHWQLNGVLNYCNRYKMCNCGYFRMSREVLYKF